jgi:IS5 family transposase
MWIASEGRISILKRGYGWDRTRIDNTKGPGSGLTWVLAHDLVKIRALAAEPHRIHRSTLGWG